MSSDFSYAAPYSFNHIPPGLFEGGSAWGRGPAAYNSKTTINDNEMKFGGVVKNH